MLKMTLMLVRSLSFKIIGIILAIAFFPFFIDDASAQNVTTVLFPVNIKHVQTDSDGQLFDSRTECRGVPPVGFDSIFGWKTVSITNKFSNNLCERPIMTFDLSAIPDNATVLKVDYQYNMTSGSVIPNFSSGGGGFPNPSIDPDRFRVKTVLAFGGASAVAEDVRPLSNTDAIFTIFGCTPSATGLSDPPCNGILENIDLQVFGSMVYSCTANTVHFDIRIGTGSCFVEMSRTDPDPLTDQIELVIEGNNLLTITNCDQMEVSQKGLDGVDADCDNSGFYGQINTSTFEWGGDASSIQLDVTWEIFNPPSEPVNVSCTNTASQNFIDWDASLDDGGKPITGYQIERSTNFGLFTIIVPDTGSATPTNFTESVSVNESQRYIISALNAEGVGGSSTESNSCGIPAVADPPIGLFAFQQSTNDIGLDWTRPNFDGALPITGYFIERSAEGGTFVSHVPTTGNDDTNFVDLSVQSNVLFTYRVSTINSFGTSSPSNEASFTISIGGAGAGDAGKAPVPPPPEVSEELLTQAEFDLALAQAIASIPPQQITVFEQVVSTFFEFAVVDTSVEDLVLGSFLQDQRLGIRWSSGQDIVVVSATPSASPFTFTFEQFPVVKQGSGAVISTDFISYNIQVPSNQCEIEVTTNCAERLRYEIPITVNAIINGSQVSDDGTITVDLVDELLDPILVLLLATFGIPLIGVFVQRSRKRSVVQAIRRVPS